MFTDLGTPPKIGSWLAYAIWRMRGWTPRSHRVRLMRWQCKMSETLSIFKSRFNQFWQSLRPKSDLNMLFRHFSRGPVTPLTFFFLHFTHDNCLFGSGLRLEKTRYFLREKKTSRRTDSRFTADRTLWLCVCAWMITTNFNWRLDGTLIFTITAYLASSADRVALALYTVNKLVAVRGQQDSVLNMDSDLDSPFWLLPPPRWWRRR